MKLLQIPIEQAGYNLHINFFVCNYETINDVFQSNDIIFEAILPEWALKLFTFTRNISREEALKSFTAVSDAEESE